MPLRLSVAKPTAPGWGRGNLRGRPLGGAVGGHHGLELGSPLLSRMEPGLAAEELGEVDEDLSREDLVIVVPDLVALARGFCAR